MCRTLIFLVAGLPVVAAAASGQAIAPTSRPGIVAGSPATAPSAPRLQDLPSQRLGEPFVSRAAGITFKPPAGGVQTRRMGYGEEIVQYSNTDEKWSLKVSRVSFDRAALLVKTDPKPSDVEPGILDQSAHQLLLQNVNTEILRKDVINVGAMDAGLLCSRFTQGGSFWLRQQAFLRANDQLFYIFDFITPSNRTISDKPDYEDPAERMAIDIFRAMLDSIELLNQRDLLKDNQERLYRTRQLQVDLADRLRQAIVPDQYFRVMREGKDVGWIYVAEEMGEYQGKSGLIVATVRSGRPDEKTLVNVSAEAFWMPDGNRQGDEAWMTITRVARQDASSTVTELGQSGRRSRRVRDKTAGEDKLDPRQPAVRVIERYEMTVTQSGGQSPRTIERELPPYYLPNAASSLILRVLPTREAKGYLFAAWVGAEGEVIYRYLDVQPQQEALFNGQMIQAVVIKDRIGLEGDPTFHYLNPEGKYLGSTCPATGVVIVATDMQTITRLFPDAKVVRPHLLEGRTR